MKRFLNLLLVLLLTSAYAGTVFADGPDKKGQAQKLRLSSVKREKYVGIKNHGHECSLISAVQMLYHEPEFRELILEQKVDATKQPYLAKLKEQFERMDEGTSPEFLVFNGEQVKDLIGITEFGCEGFAGGKWAGTRILEKCIDECRMVKNIDMEKIIRDIFDFNYTGEADIDSPLLFAMSGECDYSSREKTDIDRNKEFGSVIKSAKRIPKSITVYGFNDKFSMDQKITLGDHEYEVCKAVMCGNGHAYIYCKDPCDRTWKELNDTMSKNIPAGRKFRKIPLVIYVFNEV